MSTGDKKAILGEDVVSLKTGIPSMNWVLRFKHVDPTTKAFLEDALYNDINNLILKTAVNPRYYIHRNTSVKAYYLTYIHEFAYYEKAVNRVIPFTTEGTNDILEGGAVIPHSGPYVVLGNSIEYPRKVRYMETKNTVTHDDYKLFSMSVVVKDFARPVANSVTELVGGSNVVYNPTC
jgi:hypothetical protein